MNKRHKRWSVARDIALDCIVEHVGADAWVFNDQEFDRFCDRLIVECSLFVQDMVDRGVPESEYVLRIRRHFDVSDGDQ